MVQKFTRQEVKQADSGQIDTPYQVFMSTPRTAGINNRAMPVFERHPDGRERVDENGNKRIDDEIGAVSGAFREWVESTI